MLPDKIVFGARSDDVGEKLLAEQQLDFKRVIMNGRSSEATQIQLNELRRTEEYAIDNLKKQSATTNKNVPKFGRGKSVDNRQTFYNQQPKYRQCASNHRIRTCAAYSKTCHKCNGKGHFASCCRSKINAGNVLEIEDELFIRSMTIKYS